MAPPASSSDGAASSSHIESITSPTCLRKVVLNYLLHHCYADTAAAFAGNTSGSASSSSNGAYNDASAAVDSSSNGTETPRRSRHPLAAPPLLRQDSSIEVEADANLVAAGAGVNEESDDADMQDAVTADTTFTAAPASAPAPLSDVSRSGAEITSSDLRILSLRQEVRGHILDGNIKLATELLNTHFPSVLGEGSVGDGEDGEGEASATPTATTWTTSSGWTAALPSASTSLQPQHLALNLQIQTFIESVRAANAPPQTPAGHYGGGGGGAGQSMAATAAAGAAAASSPSTSGPAAPPPLASLSRSSSPAPSSVSSTSSISTSSSFAPTSSSAPPTALQQALANAQSLYIAVQRLPPGPYQTIYRREIEGVTAILAYKDLERSPLKKFLDTKRRRMLSEQVNAAILCE